jgi:hypothetical protein
LTAAGNDQRVVHPAADRVYIHQHHLVSVAVCQVYFHGVALRQTGSPIVVLLIDGAGVVAGAVRVVEHPHFEGVPLGVAVVDLDLALSTRRHGSGIHRGDGAFLSLSAEMGPGLHLVLQGERSAG